MNALRWRGAKGGPMRVAVLVPPRINNGRVDQDDTFVQADEVSACLRDLGHEAIPAEYADHGLRTVSNLSDICPDIVVNLVEEVPEGPDQVHRATALLDRLGIPYTGARTPALLALGDKRTMKPLLAAAGLPIVPGIEDAPPYSTFIVKSAIEHASLGMDASSVVHGIDAARELIAQRHARFGGEWFAEVYIDGREFDVSLLETPDGTIVLPIAEIAFSGHQDGRPRLFDYDSKWAPDSASAHITQRIFPPREEPLFTELERLARAAWNCFDLSGFAHVDFRVDRNGMPYILEVNPNPCIGHEAGICEAASKIGLSQTDVVAALLAAA